MTRTFLALALIIGGFAGRAVAADAKPNTLTSAEKSAGWQLLFDGKSLDGWRGYKEEKIGAGQRNRTHGGEGG